MAASTVLRNLCDNLNFKSMKDFWIAELEEGKIESLLNVESKGRSEILKFETVTVNLYPCRKRYNFKTH